MEEKANILIYPLIIMGMLVFFVAGCKKDDNNNGQQSIPVISTSEITAITETTAVSGGNVTNDGGAGITVRGVCWSTTQNPTISDNKTQDGSGTGSFISIISGLEPNTTYYVRAYATNSVGTGYGSIITFQTIEEDPNHFTDPRDSTVYRVVAIGNQIWMAENLKYLPAVSHPSSGSYSSPHHYVYDYYGSNVSAAKSHPNYSAYGVLYNWAAAMAGSSSNSDNPSGVQGICPPGWHLPSDAEWVELTNYIGASGANTGGKLKSTRTAPDEHPHWESPNAGATDEYGFSALPGGFRASDRKFYNIGYYGIWWTTSEIYTYNAWGKEISFDDGCVGEYRYYKALGLSVRCVMD